MHGFRLMLLVAPQEDLQVATELMRRAVMLKIKKE